MVRAPPTTTDPSLFIPRASEVAPPNVPRSIGAVTQGVAASSRWSRNRFRRRLLAFGGVAAGAVERVVPSGGLPKRCALFGSVSAGLNGDGDGLCADASPASAAASAPSARVRAFERPRGRAGLRCTKHRAGVRAPSSGRTSDSRSRPPGRPWLTRVKDLWLTSALRPETGLFGRLPRSVTPSPAVRAAPDGRAAASRPRCR